MNFNKFALRTISMIAVVSFIFSNSITYSNSVTVQTSTIREDSFVRAWAAKGTSAVVNVLSALRDASERVSSTAISEPVPALAGARSELRKKTEKVEVEEAKKWLLGVFESSDKTKDLKIRVFEAEPGTGEHNEEAPLAFQRDSILLIDKTFLLGLYDKDRLVYGNQSFEERTRMEWDKFVGQFRKLVIQVRTAYQRNFPDRDRDAIEDFLGSLMTDPFHDFTNGWRIAIRERAAGVRLAWDRMKWIGKSYSSDLYLFKDLEATLFLRLNRVRETVWQQMFQQGGVNESDYRFGGYVFRFRIDKKKQTLTMSDSGRDILEIPFEVTPQAKAKQTSRRPNPWVVEGEEVEQLSLRTGARHPLPSVVLTGPHGKLVTVHSSIRVTGKGAVLSVKENSFVVSPSEIPAEEFEGKDRFGRKNRFEVTITPKGRNGELRKVEIATVEGVAGVDGKLREVTVDCKSEMRATAANAARVTRSLDINAVILKEMPTQGISTSHPTIKFFTDNVREKGRVIKGSFIVSFTGVPATQIEVVEKLLRAVAGKLGFNIEFAPENGADLFAITATLTPRSELRDSNLQDLSRVVAASADTTGSVGRNAKSELRVDSGTATGAEPERVHDNATAQAYQRELREFRRTINRLIVQSKRLREKEIDNRMLDARHVLPWFGKIHAALTLDSHFGYNSHLKNMLDLQTELFEKGNRRISPETINYIVNYLKWIRDIETLIAESRIMFTRLWEGGGLASASDRSIRAYRSKETFNRAYRRFRAKAVRLLEHAQAVRHRETGEGIVSINIGHEFNRVIRAIMDADKRLDMYRDDHSWANKLESRRNLLAIQDFLRAWTIVGPYDFPEVVVLQEKDIKKNLPKRIREKRKEFPVVVLPANEAAGHALGRLNKELPPDNAIPFVRVSQRSELRANSIQFRVRWSDGTLVEDRVNTAIRKKLGEWLGTFVTLTVPPKPTQAQKSAKESEFPRLPLSSIDRMFQASIEVEGSSILRLVLSEIANPGTKDEKAVRIGSVPLEVTFKTGFVSVPALRQETHTLTLNTEDQRGMEKLPAESQPSRKARTELRIQRFAKEFDDLDASSGLPEKARQALARASEGVQVMRKAYQSVAVPVIVNDATVAQILAPDLTSGALDAAIRTSEGPVVLLSKDQKVEQTIRSLVHDVPNLQDRLVILDLEDLEASLQTVVVFLKTWKEKHPLGRINLFGLTSNLDEGIIGQLETLLKGIKGVEIKSKTFPDAGAFFSFLGLPALLAEKAAEVAEALAVAIAA